MSHSTEIRLPLSGWLRRWLQKSGGSIDQTYSFARLTFSGHTALNVKTFGYSTSCTRRSVLGALLSNGPEGCQAGIRAANTRNNASVLTVSVGPQISCAYFGIAASRHSGIMRNHLSLRSHSICEAVHTPCDRCREIDKNVMPVTPCFPTRTAPSSLLGLFSLLQPLQANAVEVRPVSRGSNSGIAR